MTETSHRTYAVAMALVVFFLAWAAVAARPWAPAKVDPRVDALRAREQRLRADATLVSNVVDSRWAAYRVALRARQAQIAQARTMQAARTAPAPAVRIVTLPPLTVTRSS